jgi:hypothetical protein
VSPKGPNVFCFDSYYLEKGYHEGLDILSPPEDNDWWEGDFTHFDFDSTFQQIAEYAPKTMANKSFEKTKWIINSTNHNEPVQWNESNQKFFGDFFIKYLQEKGKN